MNITNLSFNQTLQNFAFCMAVGTFDLTKKVIGFQKKKYQRLKKLKKNLEANYFQEFKQSYENKNQNEQGRDMKKDDLQSRNETIKQKIMRHKQVIINQAIKSDLAPQITDTQVDPYIIQCFAKAIKPQIFAKFPTAPIQKVNKVVMQKWANFQQSKKEAFIKKIKQRELANQSKKSQLQSKNRDQQRQQVLVKQQAQQPQDTNTEPQKIEQHQNRFGQFLNRIKNNIKGMEQQTKMNQKVQYQYERSEQGNFQFKQEKMDVEDQDQFKSQRIQSQYQEQVMSKIQEQK